MEISFLFWNVFEIRNIQQFYFDLLLFIKGLMINQLCHMRRGPGYTITYAMKTPTVLFNMQIHANIC